MQKRVRGNARGGGREGRREGERERATHGGNKTRGHHGCWCLQMSKPAFSTPASSSLAPVRKSPHNLDAGDLHLRMIPYHASVCGSLVHAVEAPIGKHDLVQVVKARQTIFDVSQRKGLCQAL